MTTSHLATSYPILRKSKPYTQAKVAKMYGLTPMRLNKELQNEL